MRKKSFKHTDPSGYLQQNYWQSQRVFMEMATQMQNEQGVWNDMLNFTYWRGSHTFGGFGGTTAFYSNYGSLLGMGSAGGGVLGMGIITEKGISFIQDIFNSVLSGTLEFSKNNDFSPDLSSNDLIKVFLLSYLKLRDKFDNKTISELDDISIDEIGWFLYKALQLDPDISYAEEYPMLMHAIAKVQYLLIAELPLYSGNTYRTGEWQSEEYPYFTMPNNYITIYTNIYTNVNPIGFQVQWVIRFLL